jgi:hypothetical protein
MAPQSPASISRLGLGLFCAALAACLLPARAEDPLLGRIKVIHCVGCTPGTVDLVIHDPIDVRDFQVRINESDYQKIITPLAGKTVYEKDGCFYWFDAPKGTKKAGADSSASGASAEGAGAEENPGTPSRCVPFTRVESKPSKTDAAKD